MHATPRSKSIAIVFPSVAADLEWLRMPKIPTKPQKNVKHIGIPQNRSGRPYPRGLGGAAA
jgi:hypothetical protein